MRLFVMGFAGGVLSIPAVVLIAGWFGLLPTRASVAPPAWEMAFAHHALHAAAARHGGEFRNPVLATEANLDSGMKLFRGDCAGCHGSPTIEGSQHYLYPPPADFWKHAPTLPEGQLFWIVKNGVRYSGMFAFSTLWKDSTGRDPSDEKIWTMVTFLHHLDSLPPTVAAAWHTKPPS